MGANKGDGLLYWTSRVGSSEAERGLTVNLPNHPQLGHCTAQSRSSGEVFIWTAEIGVDIHVDICRGIYSRVPGPADVADVGTWRGHHRTGGCWRGCGRGWGRC